MGGVRAIGFLLCMIAGLSGRAQIYYTNLEVGVSGGGSQYFGDLNEHYGFRTVNYSAGICARQRLNSYIAVKVVANFTRVGYDDKYNTAQYQVQRNLNFKSDIFEFAAQAEFNFFSYITGDKEHRYTPYLTGGIGVFNYDPYTTYNGKRTYLRPLGTEGQFAGYNARKYSSMSPCFPLGAGLKFWVRGGINVIFEVADRLTTTDYLDDVSSTYVGINKFKQNSAAAALQDRSKEIAPNVQLGTGKQRGNTASYDQYLIANVTVTFNFTSYRCPRGVGTDDEMRRK